MARLIPLSVPFIRGNEWKYVKECIDTEWVSTAGKYVELFEERICEFTGARHAIACVNGTSALQVCLRVAGVAPDDEVIVPAVTFIAPVNAASYIGAQPLFMDCDEYYNMDTHKVRRFLEQETRREGGFTWNRKTGRRISAIVPVHVFGNPVDLEPLLDILEAGNIRIVEDASESIGSRYTTGMLAGRHTGNVGDMGCFSFNGNKIITTGGGGMIITDDDTLADRARYLTTQAKDDPVRYVHHEIGYNFRMPNINAAIGVGQLESLPGFVETKQKNFDYYKPRIDAIPGLHLSDAPAYGKSNYWHYALRVDQAVYGKDREQLMQYLDDNSIQTRPLWHLNHLQKPYADHQAYDIDLAPRLLNETLNIPCSVGLTNDDMDAVISALKNG